MGAANQLSFLPDDYLQCKAQRRSNIICAALAFIVIVTIGTAFTATEHLNRKADRDNALVQAQYADAARQIRQVQELQDKQRRMARQAELAESLLEKVPRSYLLAEITNALPEGVSLLDFVLDAKRHTSASASAPMTAYDRHKAAIDTTKGPPPAPLPEPVVYDVTMKLTGVADTDVQVSNFIGKLSRSPLLRDVNLVISDEYTMADQKLRRFQLEMTLDPNAEIKPGETLRHDAPPDRHAPSSREEVP